MSNDIPFPHQDQIDGREKEASINEPHDRLHSVYLRIQDELERFQCQYKDLSHSIASAPPGRRATQVGLAMIVFGTLSAFAKAFVPLFPSSDILAATLIASGSLLISVGIIAEVFIRIRSIEIFANRGEEMTADVFRELRKARENLL